MDAEEVKQFTSLGWTKDDFEVEMVKRWREDKLVNVAKYVSIGFAIFAIVICNL